METKMKKFFNENFININTDKINFMEMTLRFYIIIFLYSLLS